MPTDKRTDADEAEGQDISAERLTAPAFELEQRRQKIQNEVKQDGSTAREAEKAENQDG